MKKKYLARVFVKGGMVSPAYMLKILDVAKKLGNQYIHFGSKQDILFEIKNWDLGWVAETLHNFDVKLVINTNYKGVEQNITSSYLVNDILPSTPWVSAGTYVDILDDFNYTPKLSINITDPAQNLVPLFYGELNYIASEKEDYWYLYIKFRFLHVKMKWPGLIFSKDIPGLSLEIEELIFEIPGISTIDLIEIIVAKNNYYFLEMKNDLVLPEGFSPYYEGINTMLNGDKYWAGFYWKNNCYDIQFIEVITKLCLKTNLSKICITPWKSFLIKDIDKKNLIGWEQIIGRFGINMRHSSFDLNWHLPLLSDECYKLKKYITREFNNIDIRTYGITISVSRTIEEKFTTIVILMKPMAIFFGRFYRYDIYYIKNFNIHNDEYILHCSIFNKSDIVSTLVELSKMFYIKLSVPKIKLKKIKDNSKLMHRNLFQCNSCLTIYDEEKGDKINNIAPNTSFNQLPSNYKCPTCENEKNGFELIKIYENINTDISK